MTSSSATRPVTKYERFGEGVSSHSIGSVQAAGHFASGKQSGYPGTALDIDANTAHGVMSHGCHTQGPFRCSAVFDKQSLHGCRKRILFPSCFREVSQV